MSRPPLSLGSRRGSLAAAPPPNLTGVPPANHCQIMQLSATLLRDQGRSWRFVACGRDLRRRSGFPCAPWGYPHRLGPHPKERAMTMMPGPIPPVPEPRQDAGSIPVPTDVDDVVEVLCRDHREVEVIFTEL